MCGDRGSDTPLDNGTYLQLTMTEGKRPECSTTVSASAPSLLSYRLMALPDDLKLSALVGKKRQLPGSLSSDCGSCILEPWMKKSAGAPKEVVT